jgi:VanZ family protein
MKIKVIQFIPVVIWFIIANILFFMPGQDLPSSGFLEDIYFDKWVHIGLFSGLTFLTAYPFIRARRSTKKMLIKISILFVIYGVSVEFIQKYFASERSFDISDMIADTVGCCFGYVVSMWLIHKLRKKTGLNT